MYKDMLVPLDGSELAEVVFPYAKELAGRLDLNVVLLNVCRPQESQLLPMHRAYVERVAELVLHQSEEVQGKLDTQQRRKNIEVRAEVVTGPPAEEILRYADKNNCDLILIATHGRSGISRWAMGSVADEVLRESKVPVWLVRAGIPQEIVYDKWPKRTMLVPLDGSQLGESVLAHVEALAKQRGAELVDVVLLRVCQPPVTSADYSEAETRLSWEKHVEQEQATAKRASEHYLSKVEQKLKGAGIRAQSVVLTGMPADVIIDYANKNPFNLIVMSTHGYSGVGRWYFGSIANKVLHGSSSPIFLVRPH